jgi:hypothetical protein
MESGTDELTFRLAPLILQETKDHIVMAGDSFGRIMSADGELKIDASRPEVYVQTDTVVIGQKPHLRLTYLWYYSGENSAGSPNANTCQGVRMTIDATGNPSIWEILADDSRRELIFVSKSLEGLTAGEFGKPLPKRRYAIERTLDEAPTTVVPRVIEDGPMQMGPIIYLAAGTRNVSTLICRCMPAQARAVVASSSYELVPFAEATARGSEFFSKHCRGVAFWPEGGVKEIPLEKRLRMPRGF